MANNDQEEMYEKLMAANLARTVHFIKFAETKNAALLTFCSAWMLGVPSLLSSGKAIPLFVDSGFRLSFIFFALGAYVAITSFLARLSLRQGNWEDVEAAGELNARSLSGRSAGQPQC
ncbi:hypothetical protein [Caballeronia sp. LjRoot31]|uniref:hypothetical protein n=1 Tax=Caballeronia sp. LjRoot31 TaxID=3342324 RepID=UPI003ECDEA30